MTKTTDVYGEKGSRVNPELKHLDLSYEVKSDLLHLTQDVLKGSLFASGSFVFFKLFLPLAGVTFTEVALSGIQLYAAIAGSMIFVLLKLHTSLKLLRPYFTFAMTIWQFSVLRGVFEMHKDLGLIGLVGLSFLALIFLYLSHRYDTRLKGSYLRRRQHLEESSKDFFEAVDDDADSRLSNQIPIKDLNSKSNAKVAELEAMLEERFGPVSFVKNLDLENLENIDVSEGLPASSKDPDQTVKAEEEPVVEELKGETYEEEASEANDATRADTVEEEAYQPESWLDDKDEFDDDFYRDSFDSYDEDLERERALRASKRRVRNIR